MLLTKFHIVLFWLSVIKYDFFLNLIQIWSKEPPLILLIDLFTLDEDYDHFYLTVILQCICIIPVYFRSKLNCTYLFQIFDSLFKKKIFFFIA
jgi:hypothetical protein